MPACSSPSAAKRVCWRTVSVGVVWQVRARSNRVRTSILMVKERVMAAKFEVYQDKSGEYRFRLKAANGQVVATGESYPTKAGAHKGCEAVKAAAAAADVLDV